jgi:hypothetical protein
MQPVRRLLLFLGLFLILLPGGVRAQTAVQSANGAIFYGHTSTFTMTSNVTAGHAYVVQMIYDNFVGVNLPLTWTLTDNNSETLLQAVKLDDLSGVIASGATRSIAFAYLCNITASPNSKPTFTWTLSTSTQNSGQISVFEYSNVATSACLDQTNSSTGTTGSNSVPWNGATITPTWTASMVWATTFNDIGSSPTPSGSGWATVGNFTADDDTEYKVLSSASTTTPAFILASAGTNGHTINITMNIVQLGATPAGGAARHRLLRSFLPGIPFIWARGWIPVAMFRRRRELLEIREAEG